MGDRTDATSIIYTVFGVDWVMYVCVGQFCAYTHLPVQTHVPLHCPLECHWCATDHVSPNAADNEHINMYIPSQVNACLALQFHGTVSGLRSTNRRLSIR